MMNNNLTYRRANTGDVLSLAQCRKRQLLDEGSSPASDIDRELKDYFATSLSDDSLISWLALDHGAIIATSGVCFYRLPPTYSNPTGRIAYITNMYTAPAFRRQGIATHLFKLVIEEARKLDYRIVRLHASSDGKSIYSRMGFVDSEGYMALRL